MSGENFFFCVVVVDVDYTVRTFVSIFQDKFFHSAGNLTTFAIYSLRGKQKRMPRCTCGISAVFQEIYRLNPIGSNRRISYPQIRT